MAKENVKTASDLLKLYIESKDDKNKKSFSLSLPLDIANKVDYLSSVTGKSKNSIVLEALKAFGIDDIKIPEDYEQNKK